MFPAMGLESCRPNMEPTNGSLVEEHSLPGPPRPLPPKLSFHPCRWEGNMVAIDSSQGRRVRTVACQLAVGSR